MRLAGARPPRAPATAAVPPAVVGPPPPGSVAWGVDRAGFLPASRLRLSRASNGKARGTVPRKQVDAQNAPNTLDTTQNAFETIEAAPSAAGPAHPVVGMRFASSAARFEICVSASRARTTDVVVGCAYRGGIAEPSTEATARGEAGLGGVGRRVLLPRDDAPKAVSKGSDGRSAVITRRLQNCEHRATRIHILSFLKIASA